jgi:hypothetical protein
MFLSPTCSIIYIIKSIDYGQKTRVDQAHLGPQKHFSLTRPNGTLTDQAVAACDLESSGLPEAEKGTLTLLLGHVVFAHVPWAIHEISAPQSLRD